jgi:DNA-binding response OmpR family regulator
VSRILIIDDERELVQLLKDELERRGHEVLVAGDGMDGVKLAASRPDLIILDVMMPKLDGFEVCRAIREEVRCPILFLSARQAERDRVKGLVIGGDDYIVKPFALRELLARVEANLRREARARAQSGACRGRTMAYGPLEIRMNERQVLLHGQEVRLTRREYEIVEWLALHAGQVFSREQIYEKIWGYDAEGDASTVVEHIKNIRAKLAAVDDSAEFIQTVWGIGYKWNKAVR